MMPPLPEPWVLRDGVTQATGLYTESQFREYAAQVVEACAKVCDDYANSHGYYGTAAEEAANDIRSMKWSPDGTQDFAKTMTETLGAGLLTGSAQEKNSGEHLK